MSLIDHIRQINAQKNFKIKDDFNIEGFDDLTEELNDPDHVEIWAEVEIGFEGQMPESYRVLNAIIGDWVEANVEKLTKAIHPKLVEHFKTFYPETDISAIDEEFEIMEDSPIWLDQLDYMPKSKEGSKKMTIEIELVLESEPFEEEDIKPPDKSEKEKK